MLIKIQEKAWFKETVTYRLFRKFLTVNERKNASDNKLNEVRTSTSEINSEFLIWVRKKIMKSRAYYKALTLFEKQFFNLCIFCKPKFKSGSLLRAIDKIMSKIEPHLKSFKERMIEEGRPIAEKISTVVYSWGNKDAIKWKDDENYMFVLGLNRYNSHRSWSL